MRKILLILAFSVCCHAQQPWSSVLPPSRAMNWGISGLPSSFTDKGGSNAETTTNAWGPPTRTKYGSTLTPSGGSDVSQINTALTNCADGQYVLLGSGTFVIDNVLEMYQHSCTLRGSGPQSTILTLSGSGTFSMGAAYSATVCSLTSDSNYAAGSTSIKCTAGSAPSVGSVAFLAQCDVGYSGSGCSTGSTVDNGALYICGGLPGCQSEGSSASPPYASQNQTVSVTSVSGSGTYTLGITPALVMPNWAYAQTPYITWDPFSLNGIGVGIEDMTITGGGPAIEMYNCYACWIKGNRFIEPGVNGPIVSEQAANNLISNNYIFLDTGLDSSYGPAISYYTTSFTLLLNNIFIGASEPWEGFGGSVGNVFAYNLGRDNNTSYNFDDLYDHHASSSFDLFEGNQMGFYIEDDTWGVHDLNTYLRNYTSCIDYPYTTYSEGGAPRGLGLGNYQRFENVIGNAFGTTANCPNYSESGNTYGGVYQFGNGVSLTDTLVTQSLLRWGNVSVAQQSSDTPTNSGIRFVSSEVPNTINPNANCTASSTPYSCCTGSTTGTCSASGWDVTTPSNDNIGCSYFLTSGTSCAPKYSGGTGLSWWKACSKWTTFPSSCYHYTPQPFPLAGPDISGGPYVNGYAYDTPAAIAWANLPVDTSYQNSYTVTASSWATGTETLTVSSLPSGSVHIIGAFQLSGVGSGCLTNAEFNPLTNGEILMTGSSGTTVQYALASDPGSNACEGTLKFPDVREFDEGVYQNDPVSTPSAGAPIQLLLAN